MTTFAIHTAAGRIVAVVKAQEGAPPPATGDPGYLVSALDTADEAIATSGPDSEERIRDAFEEFRIEHRVT